MKPQQSDTPTLLGLHTLVIFSSEDREDIDKTLGLIKQSYAPETVEEYDKGIKITLPDARCTVELTKERDCALFSIAINHPGTDSAPEEWQTGLESYQRQLEAIMDILPRKPSLVVSVYIAPTGSQNEALNLVKRYSVYSGRPKFALGMVSSCLLATFRTAADNAVSKRNLLLFLIDKDFPGEETAVIDLLADIKRMAVNLVNINRLYQLCQPYFPQLDPGGTEIQEKIDVIINRIRQTEPVELETLKSWLSEVMERFSTLSIMSGLIRRDQINIRAYIDENVNLLNRWGEIELAAHPTNTLIETIDYNGIIQSFDDFVDRTQALRTELETISDMVRTYLGIRQQEQNSEMIQQQVRMLHTIEGHEKILKSLTYWVVFLTIALVTLEILGILGVFH
jgi:uncharacterized protein YqgV (UPF0045/DUF77 family)